LLLEEKTALLHELDGIRKQLYEEQHRNELVENVIEARLSKTQDKVLKYYC
jgi:C-terminal processing protease CtpA/Prc